MNTMSDLMHVRATITKKLNIMVRKVEGVTSFVLTGKDEHTPDEIYFVVGTNDPSAIHKILQDLSFLIREFLKPTDTSKSESDNRTIAKYVFDTGLKAQITLCTEDHLPQCEWWVPYLDKNGAVLGFYSNANRKPSDPTTEKPVDDDEFSDDFEDDFDDLPASEEKTPVQMPVTAAEPEPVSAPAPVPVPEDKEERSDKELWNYFYGKVNVAKHAISGGSVIYACETIGELRTLLIKLICEKNGITENYLHSIDLISESHRSALLKTYPAKPESAPMIAALAAELSIFEDLMKKNSR